MKLAKPGVFVTTKLQLPCNNDLINFKHPDVTEVINDTTSGFVILLNAEGTLVAQISAEDILIIEALDSAERVTRLR